MADTATDILGKVWSCPHCGHRCAIIDTVILNLAGDKISMSDITFAELDSLVSAPSGIAQSFCPECGEEGIRPLPDPQRLRIVRR